MTEQEAYCVLRALYFAVMKNDEGDESEEEAILWERVLDVLETVPDQPSFPGVWGTLVAQARHYSELETLGRWPQKVTERRRVSGT